MCELIFADSNEQLKLNKYIETKICVDGGGGGGGCPMLLDDPTRCVRLKDIENRKK